MLHVSGHLFPSSGRGKLSAMISSDIFSKPFYVSSLSGTLIMQMLVYLMLSQRSLKVFLFIFLFIYFYCSGFCHTLK